MQLFTQPRSPTCDLLQLAGLLLTDYSSQTKGASDSVLSHALPNVNELRLMHMEPHFSDVLLENTRSVTHKKLKIALYI